MSPIQILCDFHLLTAHRPITQCLGYSSKERSLLLRHVFLVSQFIAWDVNKVPPLQLGWSIIFQHCVTPPLIPSFHYPSDLRVWLPGTNAVQGTMGTPSQYSGASALCCLPFSNKYSAGLSCSSSPQIQSLPSQLNRTTTFHLDSQGLCCGQETVPRHATRVNTGLTVHASHLSGIIFLHCLFCNAFKNMFHILNQFYSCFQ